MYKAFDKVFKDTALPAIRRNAYDETVIVNKGKDEAGQYYRTETTQKNGWVRVNQYYEDGTSTETFEK